MATVEHKTLHALAGSGGASCPCCREGKRKNRVKQARKVRRITKRTTRKQIAEET